MAGRGPAPKDPDKRVGHHAETEQTQLFADARATNVPRLPGAKGFRAETRRWYRIWTRSAQAAVFLDTDWQRLHLLAHLVDDYFGAPTPSKLSEIRLNEERLGATVMDRLRMRLKITEPEAPGLGPAPARSRQRPDPRRLSAVK